MLYPKKSYRGKPHGVGAKGGAAGKDPYTGVSPKPWGAHRRGEALAVGKRKVEDQPEMGEFPNAPQGVGVTVLGQENDLALGGNPAALTGYAEFLLEIGINMGYGMDGKGFHGYLRGVWTFGA